MKVEIPPRDGEEDRSKSGGGGGGEDAATRRPSTMLRMVPLPVPGRNWDHGA